MGKLKFVSFDLETLHTKTKEHMIRPHLFRIDTINYVYDGYGTLDGSSPDGFGKTINCWSSSPGLFGVRIDKSTTCMLSDVYSWDAIANVFPSFLRLPIVVKSGESWMAGTALVDPDKIINVYSSHYSFLGEKPEAITLEIQNGDTLVVDPNYGLTMADFYNLLNKSNQN